MLIRIFAFFIFFQIHRTPSHWAGVTEKAWVALADTLQRFAQSGHGNSTLVTPLTYQMFSRTVTAWWNSSFLWGICLSALPFSI